MRNILTFPDDILILICQHVLLQDLFTIRQTNRRLAALVLSYSSSIALPVARNTFPKAGILLHSPNLGSCHFTWLKNLVPKYLAAVAVDRFRLSSLRFYTEYHHIPAESDLGNELRLRVENGWRVLKKLSDISKDVYHLQDKDLLPNQPKKSWKKVLRTLTHHNKSDNWTIDELVERREKLIRERSLLYVGSLDPKDVMDYRIMLFLVDAAIRTNHHIENIGRFISAPPDLYEDPDYFDWAGKDGRRVARGNSWVNWAIIHAGPILFWQQWYDKRSDFIKQKLLQMWKQTPSEQISIQRITALSVEEAMVSRVPGAGHTGSWINHVDEEFNKYLCWEYGLARFHSGEPLPEAWMDDVPYFVDFKNDAE